MGRALPNHIRILVHRIREHSRRHVGPLIRLVRVGCAIFAGLFAIVMGGCGAEFGGGVGLVDFPPNVQMERWESIGPGSCKGWLTNNGSHTARDVRVSFRVQDRARRHGADPGADLHPHRSLRPHRGLRPTQITNGELRFPGLGNITWAGGSSFIPGDPAPFLHNVGFSCLLIPDSARVQVQNEQGLAYHVVLSVETEMGVTQVPLLQNTLGRLWARPAIALRTTPRAAKAGSVPRGRARLRGHQAPAQVRQRPLGELRRRGRQPAPALRMALRIRRVRSLCLFTMTQTEFPSNGMSRSSSSDSAAHFQRARQPLNRRASSKASKSLCGQGRAATRSRRE